MIHLALWFPLLAGILMLLLPKQLGRGFAVFSAAVPLVVAVSLFTQLGGADISPAAVPFLKEAGIYYALSLEGVSLLFWIAVSLVVVMGVYIAHVDDRFLAFALMMQTGLLGIFAANDLVLFYAFFEGTLIPSLLMLWFYGGADRKKAAYTFALFTLVGSLPMLAGIFAVKFIGGSPTYLISDLAQHPLGGQAGIWAFLAFIVAFAVKTPLFPLHAWLPSFHLQNHPSGLGDAMGTLYKVGVFAFLKWAIPVMPESFKYWQYLLLLIAAFTAIYGAWVAFSAKDWKTLIAYGGISHLGIAALGAFSGTAEGTVGALYLLGASMIYTAALFLFVGLVYRRTNSLEFLPVRGLASHAPALYTVGLILLMAMIGLPGLSGFPGEFSVLLGAYKANPNITFVAFLSVIAAGAYGLTAFQKTFQEQPQGAQVPDLTVREWAFSVVAVVVIVLMGFFPNLFMQHMVEFGRSIVNLVGGPA